MKRLLVTLTMFLLVVYTQGQFIHKIKGDSILITNDSCSAELNLENSTKNINGFLYNNGNGRTSFKRGMIKLNDSVYVFGGDTLKLKDVLNTLGYNGINIYNSNGILSGNRLIDLGANTFSIGKSTKTNFHLFNNGYLWLGDTVPVAGPFGIYSKRKILSSSLSAKGLFFEDSLIASSNNTTLVGFDLKPNFSTSGYSGVYSIGLRTKNANVIFGSEFGYAGYNNDSTDGVIQFKTIPGTFKTQIILRPAGNPSGNNSHWWGSIELDYGKLSILSPDYGNFYLQTPGISGGMYIGGYGTNNAINIPSISRNVLIGTNNDDSTAILKLVSTTKGFLPPVWTKTQRLTIDGISTGLIGYQRDSTENLYIYKSLGWKRILTEDDQNLSFTNIYNSNGTLTNNRYINLDTSNFSIGKASNKYFQINNDGTSWFGKGSISSSNYTLTVDSSFKINHKHWHNSKQIFRIGEEDFALFDISTDVQQGVFSFQGNSKSLINNWGLQLIQGTETNFKSGQYNYYVNFSFGSYDRFRIMNNGDILIGTNTDDTTAILNLVSSKKGFLPPKWTFTQRQAINAPTTGLIGYQIDNTENLYIKKSIGWKKILTEDDQTNLVFDPGSNGILSRTALNTTVSRSIVGSNGIMITNGDGVSGNPTASLDINGLTNETQPDIESDIVPFYDASVSSNRKTNLWRLGASKYIVLSSNVSNSTTTLNSITGFSFTATANAIYEIEIFGAYQSAATTTGIALALDIPTNASTIGINVTTTNSTAIGGTYQNSDNSTIGASTGVNTANSNTPVHAKFVVNAGTGGGTVQATFKSEVASSSVTLQASLTYMKITRIN